MDIKLWFYLHNWLFLLLSLIFFCRFPSFCIGSICFSCWHSICSSFINSVAYACMLAAATMHVHFHEHMPEAVKRPALVSSFYVVSNTWRSTPGLLANVRLHAVFAFGSSTLMTFCWSSFTDRGMCTLPSSLGVLAGLGVSHHLSISKDWSCSLTL